MSNPDAFAGQLIVEVVIYISNYYAWEAGKAEDLF